MSLHGFFAALAAGLGLAASYQDLRFRRIPNRWLALGLAAAAAGYGWLAASSGAAALGLRLLGPRALPWPAYPRLLLHAALSCSAALALWRLSVWPAGDAKLYMVLSLMLPLADFNLPGFPGRLFLVLLINTFVPAALAVLALLAGGLALRAARLGRLGLKARADALRERILLRWRDRWPHRRAYARFLLNAYLLFACMTELQRLLGPRAGGWPGRLALFGLGWLAWEPLSRALCAGGFFSAAAAWGPAAALWRAGPSGAARALWEPLADLLLFGVLLGPLRSLAEELLKAKSARRVELSELERGMIVGEEDFRSFEGLEGWRRLGWTRRYADGLSEEEARALRGEAGLARGAVVVYRAMPFAPWILAGALLTLAFPGHAGLWLARLLAWRF